MQRSVPGRRHRHGGLPWVVAAVALTALAGLAMSGPKTSQTTSEQRLRMVRDQIQGRGLDDRGVLEAMEAVPRHLFVPPELQDQAYEDHPLAIGHGQTISQPYVVARMTAMLDLQPLDRVLEIGTGSGYQAAVLAQLAAEVYSVEIIPELAEHAQKTLGQLGYRNVHVRVGDGYRGWPEKAPFDAILLTAAPPEIPRPLLDQLAVGGTLVAPVGEGVQQLQIYTRNPGGGFSRSYGEPVRFVPMTGEAQIHTDIELDPPPLRSPLPN